jgi:predicted CXXCH cytochrome family protein
MNISRILLFAIFLLLINSVTVWADSPCFQCHAKKDFSDKFVHKPVAEGNCQKCHNPHVAKYAGLLVTMTTELCYDCHDDLRQAAEGKKNVHKPFSAGNCLACHDPHSSENKGLVRAKEPRDGCLNCHTQMVDKYKYVHRPYAAGNCQACHQPHFADRFQLLAEEPDRLCLACHRGSVATAHKKLPVKVEESGCVTCHSPHGSDNPFLIRNFSHEPYQNGCDACHDNGRIAGSETCLECHEEIGEKLKAIHNHQTSKSENGCTSCHSPHASDFENMLRNEQAQVCRNCHSDTYDKYMDQPFKHPDNEICSNCHGIHGSNNLAMLKMDGKATCDVCHETQGVFTHPVGSGVIDPRNGQLMSCVTCHYPHGTVYQANLKLSGSMELCIQCHKNY